MFTSPETRTIVLPDSENGMIVASFVSTQYQRVTEGRTDGRTDRRTNTLVANTAVPALQAMRTRCKNSSVWAKLLELPLDAPQLWD